jgi:hypothetical protein
MSFAAAWVVLSGCAAFQTNKASSATTTESSSSSSDHPLPVRVDLPMNNPAERDDPKAPIMRVDVVGSSNNPVPVPYVYGYPLYADGPAIEGVRIMRQDNWAGYEREQRQDNNGVVYVSESFPVLGCRFEGIQEDEAHYVPFYVECSVPAPADRGKSRPVVGQLPAASRADAVPREPVLAKAFLGEFHATTPGFDGTEGAAYFDTPHGLVGFSFVKGKLSRIAFLFDPAEKRWRQPELWQPPAGVTIGP